MSEADSIFSAVYIHGRDGHPWFGQKIMEMRPLILQKGFTLSALSYPEDQSLETMIERTVAECNDPDRVPGRLVIIASSRGAYIGIEATRILSERGMRSVDGLFLIAPAVGIKPDYYPNMSPAPVAKRIEIVHGWNDPIIPAQNVVDFAKRLSAPLHFFDDEHRLNKSKAAVAAILGEFLSAVSGGP